MPQILIRMAQAALFWKISRRAASLCAPKLGDQRAGILCGHQRGADQYRVGAGRCHAGGVGPGKDAAFGDLDGCRRYLRQEFLGNSQIDAKVGQVAVVDPDDRRPGIERDAQFGRVHGPRPARPVRPRRHGRDSPVAPRRARRRSAAPHRPRRHGLRQSGTDRRRNPCAAPARSARPARYPDPPAHRRNDPAR